MFAHVHECLFIQERLQTLQDEDPSGFNNNTTTDNENIDNENAELIEKIEGLDQRAHLLSRLIIGIHHISLIYHHYGC